MYQTVKSVDNLVLQNKIIIIKSLTTSKNYDIIVMTPQEKQQFPQHDAEAITVNLIRSVQDNATSLIRF